MEMLMWESKEEILTNLNSSYKTDVPIASALYFNYPLCCVKNSKYSKRTEINILPSKIFIRNL